MRLARSCLDALRDGGASLSTAESLTAGLIASTLAEVPGASDVLRGGLVAYATEAKVSVLGVDAGLVEREGVVSAACAEAMAVRARELFSSDWAVSATGVAGPAEQDGQPAGTVFIAVAGPDVVRHRRLALEGDRDVVRRGSAEAALQLLFELVTQAQ
jgi:nicotinamide-nucleotide amidase